MSKLPLFINIASTVYMFAIIWFVQLVHYPMLAKVGKSNFVSYENEYTRRMGPVVAPAMTVELCSSVWILFSLPLAIPRE